MNTKRLTNFSRYRNSQKLRTENKSWLKSIILENCNLKTKDLNLLINSYSDINNFKVEVSDL